MMIEEITLQTLIDKVKDDLFSPVAGTTQKGGKVYPIFFVDQVELEVAVELSYDAEAGLKISIPQIFEGSVTGGQGKTTGHTIKVSLSPILTPEEIRQVIAQDERLKKGIERATMLALRKGSELEGEEE
jgi:hypothetical protein